MAMPPQPSGPEELDESGKLDKATEDKSGTPVAPEKPAVKKRTGLTRRRLLFLAAGGVASTMISGHGDPEADPEPFIDVVGGTPPEGAAAFRQHLRAMEGMLNGEDESARFMIPELRAELHTFTNLNQRIQRVEAIMRNRIDGRAPGSNDAVRAMESSNNMILRLIMQRLEMQRRLEITSLTRPGDADNLRRLQLQNAQLVAMLKTEINTLVSMVDHVETLTSLSASIDTVPRLGAGKEMENRFLGEVYGRINNQVQERMTAPLRVLWGQMPSLSKLTRMRGAITSSILTLRDGDLLSRRGTIVPQLLRDFAQIGDVELPDPDRAAADDGRHDSMDTGRTLVAAVTAALRAFQTNPSAGNIAAANTALDRLRVAAIRQTDKITNGRPGYLDVQKITLPHIVAGGGVDDFQAQVHLDRPAGNRTAKQGRLADVTTIAARIERRRALHQEIRNLIRKRNEEGFEQKMQALQFAYRKEMDLEFEDMFRRTSRLALRAENAINGDAGFHYASRETDARPTHDPAIRDTPEYRNVTAVGQRGYSSMVELRLIEHPEERAPLETCVRAWMADGYNPAAASFTALTAQLTRMTIPVPPNAASNRTFVYSVARLLAHAGVANLHVSPLPETQMTVLARQRGEYAQAMINHANAWTNITNPANGNAQESLEELLDMTILGYRTQALADQSQRQGRNLPWLLRASYNTPIVNLYHYLSPSQLLYEATGGRAGTDLRQLYLKGGRYMWFYKVLPPEYTAAALLGGDIERQLAAQNVTREQFERMSDEERTAILGRIEDQKSQTVLGIKRSHAPGIRTAATGVVESTRLLQTATTTPAIRKAEELITPPSITVNGKVIECVRLPEAWERRMGGTIAPSIAPTLLRERLGHNPFKRLQQACERANKGLMNYKDVLRRPAGNWWGTGDNVDAARVQQAFAAGTVPQGITDEELLWLYTKLLPGVPNVQGPDAALLQIMTQCSADITKAEAALSKSNAATREAALVDVYTARGKLLAIYLQLSSQMQLKNDALAFQQKDYMTDLARALGMHLNVAAVQYRLVDHGTSPLTMLGIRGLEHLALHKVLIPLGRYGWRKWREHAKFVRLRKEIEQSVEAKYGTAMDGMRRDLATLMDDKDAKDEQMNAMRQRFDAELAEVQRQIDLSNETIAKHAGVDPQPGEVALARADLPGLEAKKVWLLSIIALMPDAEDAADKPADVVEKKKPADKPDDPVPPATTT